jgi:hypothetical protein
MNVHTFVNYILPGTVPRRKISARPKHRFSGGRF